VVVAPRERVPLREAQRRWAELLRRIYEVDPLRWPRCAGPMRIVAFITERGDRPDSGAPGQPGRARHEPCSGASRGAGTAGGERGQPDAPPPHALRPRGRGRAGVVAALPAPVSSGRSDALHAKARGRVGCAVIPAVVSSASRWEVLQPATPPQHPRRGRHAPRSRLRTPPPARPTITDGPASGRMRRGPRLECLSVPAFAPSMTQRAKLAPNG